MRVNNSDLKHIYLFSIPIESFPGMHIFDGTIVPGVRTLAACLASCTNPAICRGVDYNFQFNVCFRHLATECNMLIPKAFCSHFRITACRKSIFSYPSGLLHWHCGNLTIAPVPAKQPWWIWINTSCEFIMNDCITTTKQSTTKPCAYFLGYTVHTGSGPV